MNEELFQFTRRALAKNIARSEIADTLAHAGWGAADIRIALRSFAEVNFPIPVPRPRPYLSAREVFVYIVMFSALYDSCYHIGSLIFALIDKLFPDPVWSHYSSGYWSYNVQDSIRSAVAHLSVAFPLFFFTFRAINAAMAVHPEQRNSRPRKWLTYLTLLIATLSLTCDIGTLVYNALSGELTPRFLLKVLTVALIAGGTFFYFLQDMRKEEKA